MKRIGFITLIILVALLAAGCGPSHGEINGSAEKMGMSDCIITKQGGWTTTHATCEISKGKNEVCTIKFFVDGTGGDDVTFDPRSKKCKQTKG